mmetsp:Transcript_16893/g.19171  ORF Transcript_16893/g.19171 Transcript_16893/m.19171 type:complete len:340 (-) Transcript_16893:1968-2987(-)
MQPTNSSLPSGAAFPPNQGGAGNGFHGKRFVESAPVGNGMKTAHFHQPPGTNGVSDNILGNNRGHVYEYKGRKIEIRDVWKDNLHEEMKIIRDVVVNYPYVAMDTEFPGVVARPIGSFHDSVDYSYQTLRCNVDLLKLIQLGIAFADEDGNFADGCACWQFHFKFSLTDDMYAQDSIDLLVRSGINFKLHDEMGIDVFEFGELLMVSGLILEPDVHWISFHGSYDFGYLLKLLTCTPLPAEEAEFFKLLRTYFPNLYDVKHMMTKVEGSVYKAGLNKLGDDLQVQRIGPMHQAGSDSLLTASIFFKVFQQHFKNKRTLEGIVGVIHGLGPDGDANRFIR